ncbi:MAG: S41 family peptidase [Vallitalea sp.]|jgi:carboxyl-terminal processing protease|nr:S41 family peptidase [Vallitalea sp.]
MTKKKNIIYGLLLGIAIFLILTMFHYGSDKIIDKVEKENGIQVVKEGYKSTDTKLTDILKYIDAIYYKEDYVREDLYNSAYEEVLKSLDDMYLVNYSKEHYEDIHHLLEEGYKSSEAKLEDILSFIDIVYFKEELYNSAYEGLLKGLDDPYTVYFNKKQFESFMEDTSGSYEGIGAIVSYIKETQEIMILSPFIGSPAEKAGLLPGDIIKKVDGEEIKGLILEEVVANRIKGKKGSKVTLTVYRETDDANIDIVITRDVITMPTISHEMLDNKIGYIRVTGFEEATHKQFVKALKELQKQGQQGMIIDLRNNPGGLLNIVVKMADELLPKGLIVYTEDKYGRKREEKSDEAHKFTKPLVVLVNGNSASASEVLSGAIKDSGIGTIVGTTTFGKGLVQRTFPLEDGSAIKVTIARYFTPNGNYINKKGIEPDVRVELPEELKRKLVIEPEKDTQLKKAIEVLSNLIAKEKK